MVRIGLARLGHCSIKHVLTTGLQALASTFSHKWVVSAPSQITIRYHGVGLGGGGGVDVGRESPDGGGTGGTGS